MDLVSIIMAAHNEERFIGQAIESVLAQDHNNWELIIVNDGSNDSSVAIASRFEDSRIRLFEQERRGVSAARNRGLEEMNGSFFCFLDADDVLTKKSLSLRIALFEGSPTTRFVNGPVVEKDESLTRTLAVHTPTVVGEPLEYLLKLDPRCVNGSTWMFRSPPFGSGFKEGMANGEDILFCIEESARGGELRSAAEPILLYRSGRATTASGDIAAVERGYRDLVKELSGVPNVSQEDVDYFKKTSKRIMLRSYLSQRRPLSALRTFLTW